ncbi:MAG TPA: hypothetical protein VFU15_11110 [Bacteroidia bacterium]|nr:hypothetical protein [Bacteroidia bacterium]
MKRIIPVFFFLCACLKAEATGMDDSTKVHPPFFVYAEGLGPMMYYSLDGEFRFFTSHDSNRAVYARIGFENIPDRAVRWGSGLSAGIQVDAGQKKLTRNVGAGYVCWFDSHNYRASGEFTTYCDKPHCEPSLRGGVYLSIGVRYHIDDLFFAGFAFTPELLGNSYAWEVRPSMALSGGVMLDGFRKK